MRKIIHLGANKTGSTTLQRNLFSQLSDIVYLGEDCKNYFLYKNSLDSLVSDDDVYYSSSDLESIFNEVVKDSDKSIFLYSNEDILTSRVPTQCARRLHNLMPEAEILLVIRNQIDAIQSFYSNHGSFLKNVPKNYWRRYVSFDDWMNYCFTFSKYSPLDSFLYHQHLSLYKETFPDSKIHILFFEDFIFNRNKFIQDLSKIFNIDYKIATKLLFNKHDRIRISTRQHRYRILRSKFLHNVHLSKTFPFLNPIHEIWNNYLSLGSKLSVDVDENWKKSLHNYYSNDNKKLMKDFSIDIGKYNYPI